MKLIGIMFPVDNMILTGLRDPGTVLVSVSVPDVYLHGNTGVGS
jgi:hypothetical protein